MGLGGSIVWLAKKIQPVYDLDALAFFAAAGITNDTQKLATDTLVKALKTNLTWAKYHAIYLFVGATALAHSINLKNPSAFNVTWNGTIVHDANGITSPTGDAYGLTGYNPSVHAILGNNHLSIYSRTLKTQGGGTSELGAINGNSEWNMNLGDSTQSYMLLLGGGSQYPFSTFTNTQGHFVATRSDQATLKTYRNAVENLSAAQVQTILIDRELTLLAVNTGAFERRSSTNLAAATIGEGLTPTEITNDRAAFQAFQTTLGRQV